MIAQVIIGIVLLIAGIACLPMSRKEFEAKDSDGVGFGIGMCLLVACPVIFGEGIYTMINGYQWLIRAIVAG